LINEKRSGAEAGTAIPNFGSGSRRQSTLCSGSTIMLGMEINLIYLFAHHNVAHRATRNTVFLICVIVHTHQSIYDGYLMVWKGTGLGNEGR
jgi:hypothetical protein